MIEEQKIIKYLVIFLLILFSLLFIALIGILEFNFRKEREMISSVLWLNAPDGPVGFEIINEDLIILKELISLQDTKITNSNCQFIDETGTRFSRGTVSDFITAVISFSISSIPTTSQLYIYFSESSVYGKDYYSFQIGTKATS